MKLCDHCFAKLFIKLVLNETTNLKTDVNVNVLNTINAYLIYSNYLQIALKPVGSSLPIKSLPNGNG